MPTNWQPGNAVAFALVAGLCLFSPGFSTTAVALDRQHERCDVASFRFTVTPSECALLHSHNSDVVTFSVRLTDMQIVRSDIVRDSHMIVRIRPVEVPTAREEVAVRGKQPITVTAGRSEYNVQDDSIIKFQGVDGHPVYVSRGLTTLEGDRIYGTRIEVLYQFDGHRNDLEAIDSQLLELFKRIDLQ